MKNHGDIDRFKKNREYREKWNTLCLTWLLLRPFRYLHKF